MQNFTNKEILSQLMRVLSSSQLSGSNVLSEFLNFIVRETLAGRGDELKEYTIGVHALKKESDFNPQLDSIVRIHAGRLRRALKEYYYELGSTDRIMIVIPKGSYVPSFELREVALVAQTDEPIVQEIAIPSSSSPNEPIEEKSPATTFTSNHKSSIAVLPFKKDRK